MRASNAGRKPKQVTPQEKRGKNAPAELSAKKRVPRHKQVVAPNREAYKPRDPRFSELSGHFNEDLFGKTYNFVSDIEKVNLCLDLWE